MPRALVRSTNGRHRSTCNQRFSRWPSAFENPSDFACFRWLFEFVVPARPASSRLVPTRWLYTWLYRKIRHDLFLERASPIVHAGPYQSISAALQGFRFHGGPHGVRSSSSQWLPNYARRLTRRDGIASRRAPLDGRRRRFFKAAVLDRSATPPMEIPGEF